MSEALPHVFYVGVGLVCLCLGLTFLGMVYMQLRCRHWHICSGVVTHRGVRRSRSSSSVELNDFNGTSGDAESEYEYVTVQVEVDGKFRTFEFAAHTDQVNDKVRVCVHPRFPRLFHCRYPDPVTGWRRWGGMLARGLVLFLSILLLWTGWLLGDRYLF